MANYIVPKAKCLETGQTVKLQDLSGLRYQPHQKLQCQIEADRLADQMSTRTGKDWQGYCQNYTA